MTTIPLSHLRKLTLILYNQPRVDIFKNVHKGVIELAGVYISHITTYLEAGSCLDEVKYCVSTVLLAFSSSLLL